VRAFVHPTLNRHCRVAVARHDWRDSTMSRAASRLAFTDKETWLDRRRRATITAHR
jgi:hypothetical protein